MPLASNKISSVFGFCSHNACEMTYFGKGHDYGNTRLAIYSVATDKKR